jgi:hypothetical protein
MTVMVESISFDLFSITHLLVLMVVLYVQPNICRVQQPTLAWFSFDLLQPRAKPHSRLKCAQQRHPVRCGHSAATATTTAAAAAAAAVLVSGDGFVLDDSAITAYQLSDPKTFLGQLLQRPYSNRVLLAPHLLGPASSAAVLDSPDMLVGKMSSSWGLLATEGFCNGIDCLRLPVVAGGCLSGCGCLL